MASRLQDVIARGLAADKPAADTVAPGTLYFSTDSVVLERSDGAVWQSYSVDVTAVPGHHATHEDGGTDPVAVTDLAGFPGTTTTFLRGDGTFVAPASVGMNLVVKTSDQTSNVNTLQNDTVFLQAVAASEVWIADGTLFVGGTATSDLQWAWNAPTGAVGWSSGARLIGGATLTSGDIQTSAIEDLTDTGFRTAGLAGASAPVSVKINAVIINGANAGTWQFRWAQQVTDAVTPVTIHSGSYMIFMKKP